MYYYLNRCLCTYITRIAVNTNNILRDLLDSLYQNPLNLTLFIRKDPLN